MADRTPTEREPRTAAGRALWIELRDRAGKPADRLVREQVVAIESEAAGAATETGGLPPVEDLAALNALERDLAWNKAGTLGDVWKRLRFILDAPGQRQLAAARLSVHPDREDAPT